MQHVWLSSTGFRVTWAWVQVLVPALMRCVNLTKFCDLWKPRLPCKVEIIMMMMSWSEGWSHT